MNYCIFKTFRKDKLNENFVNYEFLCIVSINIILNIPRDDYFLKFIFDALYFLQNNKKRLFLWYLFYEETTR